MVRDRESWRAVLGVCRELDMTWGLNNNKYKKEQHELKNKWLRVGKMAGMMGSLVTPGVYALMKKGPPLAIFSGSLP